MRTSTIAAIVLAVITAGVVFGPGNRQLRTDQVTMTVWGMPFEDRLFKDVYARGFEEATGGEVNVDYQRHSDLEMKYNAWHARGLGAEVMRIRVTTYHQMVERGMLEPLNQFIDDPDAGLSEETLAAFPPQLIDSLRVDGELYALPQDSAQFGLYYNRAIFDEYNDANPDDPIDYPGPHWTWDDLRDAARRLTVRDNGGWRTYGFDMALWALPYLHFFLGAGGEIWTDDGLTTLVNSDAGVEALEFLADLVRDGSWRPHFGSEAEGLSADARFAAGRTAMYIDGSWIAPSFELRNPDLDFAVAPPPRGRIRRGVAGSVLWAMSSQAPNKDDGWRMLNWLVQEEQALSYWQLLRVAPPAHTGVLESPGFRSTPGIRRPGSETEYLVPPMSEADFEDKAAWIVDLLTPDPETGEMPAYIPASRYQAELETELQELFVSYLQNVEHASPERARQMLADVERRIHRLIDRDRSARRLPPADRAAD